jgi:hypothetical protein
MRTFTVLTCTVALAVMASPALADDAGAPRDLLDPLIAEGAEVAATGELMEVVADPSGEITWYLETDDDTGIEVDPETVPAGLGTGDEIAAVVEVPGEAIAALDGKAAEELAATSQITQAAAGPVAEASDTGAALLEAAQDAEEDAALTQVTVLETAAAAVQAEASTAAFPPIGAHHLRFVFMSRDGRGKFYDATALDRFVTELSNYWVRESHGAISHFTYSWDEAVSAQSDIMCEDNFNGLINEGATALGMTRAQATTTRNHLVVLTPSETSSTCNTGGYSGMASVGSSLAAGGAIHMFVNVGYPSSHGHLSAHEFGHNVSLRHAGTGTCPEGIVDGPFTAEGPCTVSGVNDTYGDHRNVMGWGAPDTTLNSFQKYSLGLITQGEGIVELDANTDRYFTLAPSSTTDLTTLQGLRIYDRTGGISRVYYVDYDKGAGGVAIRRYCGSGDITCIPNTSNAAHTRILAPGRTIPYPPTQVFAPGTSFTSHTGRLQISVGSASASGATFRVTLADQSPVTLSQTTWAPTWAAQSTAVRVDSTSGRWTASSSGTWLRVSTTQGTSGQTVSVSVDANRTFTPRTGKVTFTGGAGSQALRVTQAGVTDDHPNYPASATPWDLVASRTQSGSLELGDDIDCFGFVAPVSGTYRFTSTGTGNVSGYLYNAAGSQIAYNLDSGPGLNFEVSYALTSGVQYFLSIRNSSSTATNTNTGPYTITAQVPEPSVVALSESSWAPVQTGGTKSVTVTTNQSSWSASSSASWLTLTPRSGATGRVVQFTAALNATTVARQAVVTFTAGGAVAQFTVDQPGAVDDHGSTTGTATAWDLQSSAVMRGSLELGNDYDFFSFTAPVSGTYRFTSEGTGNVSGYLYNAAGSQIAYNLDSGPGLNFEVSYALTSGVQYFLAIRNSSSTATNRNTGPYTITVTIPQAAWVTPSVTSWTPAQTGAAASPTITTNQSSWSGTSSASWLTLSPRTGTSGRIVTVTAAFNNSTTARDAVITFTANGAVSELRVHQPGAVDDHGDAPASATSWDLAATPTVAGSLGLPADIDYFAFTPAATGSYRFISAATGNPNGYLYNAAGTRLTYNLDSGPGSNFQITYTLTAGQTYYLAIRNYSQTTTNTGPYTITVTRM